DFSYDDPKLEFNVDAPNGVVMEGYLFKRASNAFKTWNRYGIKEHNMVYVTSFASIRRWFSIQNSQLVYQKKLKSNHVRIMRGGSALRWFHPQSECVSVLTCGRLGFRRSRQASHLLTKTSATTITLRQEKEAWIKFKYVEKRFLKKLSGSEALVEGERKSRPWMVKKCQRHGSSVRAPNKARRKYHRYEPGSTSPANLTAGLSSDSGLGGSTDGSTDILVFGSVTEEGKKSPCVNYIKFQCYPTKKPQ
ncbi:hypothetical protein GOODEAATRI_012088, partial [Goodea atripinnis]